jgi:DNA-directed RNA polymerase subunit beta'
VVIDSPDEKRQPRIEIKDDKGRVVKTYQMPVRANLLVSDYDEWKKKHKGHTPTAQEMETDKVRVAPGDIIAKIPRETTKTKDITGGLPRVVELFEARKPKEPAVMSEINGTVKFGGITKGLRKVSVVGKDGETREYSIPRGVHINVQEDDEVKAGEPLMDGPLNPHDILAVQGIEALQRYLVNEIQEVYRLQGVNINDKHIEVIVRQMLRWVKVREVGDTMFLLDEQVDRFVFQDENEQVQKAGGQPAEAEPLLLGITKASLSTDSFISAASFQETTRVLTEAAISGRVDHLRGLKENVIMGRLIPAGTGMEFYRHIRLRPDPTLYHGGEAATDTAATADVRSNLFED